MHADRRTLIRSALGAALIAQAPATAAHASAASLTADGRAALNRLYAAEPRTRAFASRARGILIFPSIIKGGLIWGAETGNGVLFVRGAPNAYYNISAASFGLQIGGQSFSSAMFFMNDKALAYLASSAGFALGTAPNVVVIDKGAAGVANSTTVTQDVYVFPFGQKGLMAGIDIHGSKITRIHPE